MPRSRNKGGGSKPGPKGSMKSSHPRPGGNRRKGGLLNDPVADHSGNSWSPSPAAMSPLGYSMADEAKNTAFRRRPVARGEDYRLRYKPVAFVSAGVMEPLKDLEKMQAEESQVQSTPANAEEATPTAGAGADTQKNYSPEQAMQPEDKQPERNFAAHLPVGMASSTPVQPVERVNHNNDLQAAPQEPRSSSSSPLPFIIDTTGNQLLRPEPQSEAQPAQVHYEEIKHQGNSSDSSDEVILFKGREAASRVNVTKASTLTAINKAQAPAPVQSREMDLEIRILETKEKTETQVAFGSSTKTKKPTTMEAQHDFISLQSKQRKSRKTATLTTASPSDEEAALIADYIANMRDARDDSDGSEEPDEHPGLGAQSFSILRDLGGTDSDAIPARSSDDDDDEDLEDDDNDDDEDDDDDDDSDKEDEDSQRRRLEREDARMARILAKQEELGLGSADIILYDGIDDDDDEEGAWQTAPKSSPRRRKKGSSKQAKIRQKAHWPSASQMADAFDELDLMDWNRPSLNNFKGGKKQAVFDVSDSELEQAMNMTWQKDRLKKAEKKKMREALRAQGLLGKNIDPDDLRVKYSHGMTIDDLANEFETFLRGDEEELLFPPLDKNARQIIHKLANKFHLKSQSSGSGTSRHPVLYRKKGTLPFDNDIFDAALSRIKRPWFPRVDMDPVEVQKYTRTITFQNMKTRKVPAGNARSAGYREGDVVGENATELGAENRGRAMLEKMGWSKGMSLGSADSNGIVVPITHVVKKTKAGLGDL